MKHAALFLFGLLILLLNSSAACGQGCATTLSPHFSVYSTVSRDGNNIYTSVTMQGYASIFPGPGCNMNAATHHVGAENKLNNVDHWTYSANGCPTCYFSATNNEQIVGVPGVVYPYVWDGQAICSLVGSFFNNGGSGGITGCLVPSSEATDGVGFNGSIFRELFKMIISDSSGDNFDNHYVENIQLLREQIRVGGRIRDSRKIQVFQVRAGLSEHIVVLLHITSGGQMPSDGTSATSTTSSKMDRATE